MAWQDYLQGGLVGGLMAGDYKNPATGANEILSRIPNEMSKWIKPYADAGTSVLPQYRDVMSKLLSNPQELFKMMGAGYKESPGFQWNLEQGENAINNANAAGGMLGSPQHQQQAGELATNLASQDYNKYMDSVMRLFGMGAEGTSDIFKTGAVSANSLAEAIAQVLGQKAQYEYAGTAGENQYNSQKSSNLMSTIGSALAFL